MVFGLLNSSTGEARWFDVRADRDLFAEASREAGVFLVPVNGKKAAA